MVTEKYLLENLSCADCASQIENKIKSLPEVESAHLDFLTKVLTVKTAGFQELEHSIGNVVKSVEPDIRVRQISQVQITSHPAIPWILVTAAFGVLLLLSGKILKIPFEFRIFIYVTSYLLCSWKVLFNALVKIVNGKLLDEHFLMSTASLGAMFLGEYSEALAVMVLYEIGQFMENKAVDHSRHSIKSLLNLKPDIAHRVANSQTEDVPVSSIARHDEIAVLPGERIPLDGTIVSGESSLDTSALTGEALPQPVQAGSQVLSGSINLSGRLILKVTSTDSDSTVTRILKLTEEAAARKSRTERFITRFARKYTPAVILLAISLAVIMPVLTAGAYSVWLRRALIFLVISCPCALVISVPLTNYAAIGASARRGILLKGSNFIDALARATTFVYDKTGTLTTGKLAVSAVQPAPGIAVEKLAVAALTCEDSTTHPIARAVKAEFSSRYEPEQVLLHQEFHGRGIKVQTVSTVYYAGNLAFMQEWEVAGLPSEPEETCIYIAENNHCLGIITFADEIKDDFPAIVKSLRKMGIPKHIMLTGDHPGPAAKVSSLLGLNRFHARLLPEDKIKKLETIEQSQSAPVAFIGDGLNDAPVISRAEIGIAMGAIGNPAALEAADVVLMQDDPRQLQTAARVARQTQRIMWQNICFALTVKVAVMAAGTLGIATLWEAVIADVGVTLLTVFNSLRLLRGSCCY